MTDANALPLRVVIGPTAAGKSGLAMSLARARGLSIVSADSRQVYRGFDIGTAKPSSDDRALVPHYGIDVAAPGERYSAHRWAEEAIGWMSHAEAQGRPPLIVGGTGFYVRALTTPLAPVPSLDPARRERLAAHLATLDAATVARWAARLDPRRASLGRAQHVRAIETALLAGVRLGDALAAAPPLPRRAVRYLVVDPGAALASRIATRVDGMLADGWLSEVERLVRSVPADAPAWKATGYDAWREFLAGRLSRAEATERVVVETRQYAKRQRTWCRHQLGDGPVLHVDPTHADAAQRALAWWDGSDEEAR